MGFRQIMGVHQGTVDSYLEEVLTNTVEQAAQSRALTEARLKAEKINQVVDILEEELRTSGGMLATQSSSLPLMVAALSALAAARALAWALASSSAYSSAAFSAANLA